MGTTTAFDRAREREVGELQPCAICGVNKALHEEGRRKQDHEWAPRPNTTLVQFERLGRNHAPPSVAVETDDPDRIAEAVYAHAKHYLISRDVDVLVDMEKATVTVYAGFHIGGEGKIVTVFRPENAP